MEPTVTEVAGTYEAAASQLSTVERVPLCVKLLAREYWEGREPKANFPLLGCRVCHSPTLYCTLYAL